jgi:hypothetical protein
MQKRFEKGESSSSCGKNQGRAGEFSRKLAEAQQGKDLREPLSHQSLENQQTPENSTEKDLQGSSLPQDSRKPKTQEDYIDEFLCKHSPEKDKSVQEVLTQKIKDVPLDIKLDIFINSFLSEKFLDIYENEHDRCTAIEFLEKAGDQSVALKLVEQMTDERLGHDTDARLRMISAVGRLGDQSVVPELLNKLSSHTFKSIQDKGAIAGVAVMLDRQLAVPKFLEMLSKESTPLDTRLMMAFAIGMSEDQSVVPELHSIRSSIHPNIDRSLHTTITNAIELLESPSIGSELVKVISEYMAPIDEWNGRQCIVGKLGDISVAQKLVEMLSCCKEYTSHAFTHTPRTVGEIGRRLGNSEEIKELFDDLLNVIYNKNLHHIEPMREIPKAVGELGKRLEPKDVKELSNKLVATLFDERIPQRAAPFIANAVFELEQHFVEPDPFKRFLNLGEVRKKACEKIKEEILTYRQKFTEAGKDISEFYEMLSKAAFINNTRKEIRLRVFYPIMGTADPSFAPKLEQLAALENRYGPQHGSPVLTKKGWYITTEELQRMRKLAYDLRNRPSSEVENLSQ